MNYNEKENVDLSYLNRLGYFKKDYENLVFKFAGSESINNNYSQSMQDMFTLSMLNGKRDGLYVEIGANNPIRLNNTYLLESQFGWSGISFEINNFEVSNFNSIRSNKCILTDASKFDYKSLFESKGFAKQIDYLQVDCEPPSVTLECLKKIPLDIYRFSVITFETDLYAGGADVQIYQEEILSFYGYKRIVKNIMDGGNAFEDWWIDPLVVPESIWGKFVNENIEFRNVILK